MRPSVLSAFWFLLCLPGTSQVQDANCPVQEPAKASIQQVVERLRRAIPTPALSIDVVYQPELEKANAYGNVGRARTGVAHITIDSGMLAILENHEAELAFVIAHELGHNLDTRSDLELKGQSLSQHVLPALRSQNREMFADNVAIQYLIRAGYDWLDGAAFLGRLAANSGGGLSVPSGALLGRYSMTHPLAAERIQGLRRYVYAMERR